MYQGEASSHPDSVSLVKPPKITMPNTLAALPSNQYATVFSLTSGNLDVAFSRVPLAAFAKDEVLMPPSVFDALKKAE